MGSYTAKDVAEIDKMKRKMKPQHRQSAKQYAAKFESGFKKLGIKEFPVYKNPQDFARRFERCSILIETPNLSTSAGTNSRRS